MALEYDLGLNVCSNGMQWGGSQLRSPHPSCSDSERPPYVRTWVIKLDSLNSFIFLFFSDYPLTIDHCGKFKEFRKNWMGQKNDFLIIMQRQTTLCFVYFLLGLNSFSLLCVSLFFMELGLYHMRKFVSYIFPPTFFSKFLLRCIKHSWWCVPLFSKCIQTAITTWHYRYSGDQSKHHPYSKGVFSLATIWKFIFIYSFFLVFIFSKSFFYQPSACH